MSKVGSGLGSGVELQALDTDPDFQTQIRQNYTDPKTLQKDVQYKSTMHTCM